MTRRNKGIFVRRYGADQCWICGSMENPSREHKFKASDLRRHYGDQALYVGHEDAGNFTGSHAQGLGSKHLKFKSTICQRCNSTVTQASDRAYDKFVQVVEVADDEEAAIATAYTHIDCLKGTDEYTSLFRYFAKLLGCHLADISAPIPTHLSRFVAKKTNRNCIWLGTRADVSYADMASRLGERGPYAAHGGLVVITKAPKLLPARLYSTSTVGAMQFIFYFVLTLPEIWEMRLRHPKFIRWCADSAKAAIETPISEDQLRRLGLLE
ncbi:MAG: hypothetical protein R3D45_16365 [Rhizobiaceae bacterium]